MLKDTAAMKKALYTVSDIPDELSQRNKDLIQMTMKGYQTSPKKVLLYVMDSEEETDPAYAELEKYMETVKFNWLAAPYSETDGKAEELSAWIKSQRNAKRTVKAVLPNIAADTEGVVNVAASLYRGENEYPPEQATARIAGLIAGTPLTMSCTYAPLGDFTDCTRLSAEKLDEAVDAGKLVFLWDGEKVKICRGVNSLTTMTPQVKGESFKKIKIVEVMDMIQDDITLTVQDFYIGKYPNSYDNKCLLITAINQYFSELVRAGVLASGSCEVDVEAQRGYLQAKGEAVEELSEQETKEANTGSHVFLKAGISILDAIEDIDLAINI